MSTVLQTGEAENGTGQVGGGDLSPDCAGHVKTPAEVEYKYVNGKYVYSSRTFQQLKQEHRDTLLELQRTEFQKDALAKQLRELEVSNVSIDVYEKLLREYDSQSAELSGLENDIVRLRTELRHSDTAAQMADLQEQMRRLKGENETLGNEMIKARRQNSIDMVVKERDIQELQEEYYQLQASQEEAQNAIRREQAAAIEQLQSQMLQASGQIAEEQSRIASLNAQLLGCSLEKEQLLRLQKQSVQLQQLVEELELQIDQQKAQHTYDEQEIEILKKLNSHSLAKEEQLLLMHSEILDVQTELQSSKELLKFQYNINTRKIEEFAEEFFDTIKRNEQFEQRNIDSEVEQEEKEEQKQKTNINESLLEQISDLTRENYELHYQASKLQHSLELEQKLSEELEQKENEVQELETKNRSLDLEIKDKESVIEMLQRKIGILQQ